MQCKGFLFDLDGTLVDSLPVVERSWCHWADRHGIDHQDVLNFIHGKQAITSLRHFMPGKSEEEIAAEFTWLEAIEAADTDGIAPLPGAIALLQHLDSAGIPWAIVTSGSVPVAHARHQAQPVCRRRKCLSPRSRLNTVNRSPTLICWALNCWGSRQQECVVVEDAAAGVLAGLAAGCHVIAVNVPADSPRLEEADFVLTSLEALNVAKQSDGTAIVTLNA